MTDWLTTADLAAQLGTNTSALLRALEAQGIAQGSGPAPLAVTHDLGADTGEGGTLWHPDVATLVGPLLNSAQSDRGDGAAEAQQELLELEGVEGPEKYVDPGVARAYGFDAAVEPLVFTYGENNSVDAARAGAVPKNAAQEGWTQDGSTRAAQGGAATGVVGNPPKGYDAVLATDGSCSGNPGPGGWAWVEQLTGQRDSGGARRTTNNIMELTAMVKGLEHVGPAPDLLIRADSRYVINVMTKWARGWRKKGWKKADGKPVANRELVARLLELYEARTGRTDVVWVKGHAGDEANELVDSMAVKQTEQHR